jgi:putative transposase
LRKDTRRLETESWRELKRKYPYAGRNEEERRQNVADTREFRRYARRLRERKRKEGRVRQIAREVTKAPP